MSTVLMDAFYGQPSYGPWAWAQRGVIEKDVRTDLESRLRFYAEANAVGLPHQGALFVVLDGDTVVGFVDVGLPLFDAATRRFKLPRRPEGGEPGEMRACETRPPSNPAPTRTGARRLTPPSPYRSIQLGGITSGAAPWRGAAAGDGVRA